jgi:two-component system response regulator NreC
MIRIFILDDHELFRTALRLLLTAHAGLEVVGDAASAREALDKLARCACDVLLVDVTLEDTNGIAFARELKRLRRDEAILFLSMHAEPDVVTDAFSAGATGYALKSQSERELVDAIGVVARRERYLAPQLSPRLAARGDVSAAHSQGGLLGLLSPREREIFDLLIRGVGNDAIAQRLFISVKTVETHRTRIMRKLGVHSLGELIRLAARRGLLAA